MKKQIKKTKPTSKLKKFKLDKRVVSSLDTKRVKGGRTGYTDPDGICRGASG